MKDKIQTYIRFTLSVILIIIIWVRVDWSVGLAFFLIACAFETETEMLTRIINKLKDKLENN